MILIKFSILLVLLSSCKPNADHSLLVKDNPKTIYSCNSKNITLNCFGKSKQTSRFEWKLNGNVINGHDNTSGYSILATEGNHSTLIIQNFSKRISGIYTCTELTKNAGLSTQNKFNVIDASWNLTINIFHKQYWDNYLISVIFKNYQLIRGWNVTYSVDYKCLSASSKYCPKDWITLSPCNVNKTTSLVKYSCLLQAKRIMFFYEYVVKASARLPCQWINATSSFMVDLPETPEFEDFKAVIINYNKVELTWKKVPLLNDLKDYDSESIKMRMMITKKNRNSTLQLIRELRSWDTSTIINGFIPNRNYSISASYRFVVMGLSLDSSKVAGPVFLHMPPKAIISDPPSNQSCSAVANKTGRYHNISWLIPPERGFLGKSLFFNVKLFDGGKMKLMKIAAMNGKIGSILIASTESVKAEISICNEAGCSDRVSVVCKSINNPHQLKGEEDSLLKYITVAALFIACLSIISVYLFLKKRKMRRRPRAATIEVVEPCHQYDEPMHLAQGADNPGQETAEYSTVKDITHLQLKIEEDEMCISDKNIQNVKEFNSSQLTSSIFSLDITDINTSI